MFGIVIDKKTGLVLDRCVIIEDYEPKETEEVVPYEYSLGNPVGTMNKPRWIGREWIDTAPLPPVAPEPQEPDKMEVLKARLNEVENVNAGLLLEIAMLKQN